MKRLLLILSLLIASPVWACDIHERLYNTGTTVDFCLWETDGTDFKTDAVLVAGDIKVMKDEGAEANCSTGTGACVTDEGNCYSVALTATEMQAARVMVQFIDSPPKAFLDKCLIIQTYGNASAQFPAKDVNTATISASAITATSIATGAITNAKFASGAIDAAAIATDAIGAAELAADSIGSSEIATGAIDTTALAANSITATSIASNAITSAKIATDAIGAAQIAADAIGASEIATNAIADAEVSDTLAVNITGNLSGSVGSVTGAVGSVTGNVGGTINGLTAAALADFFDTDSGTTYASAVAGSAVKEIADNAGSGSCTNTILHTGTAQSGGSKLIRLASGASADDNAYVGSFVCILANTGEGQCRRIKSYNGTTKVATVNRKWATVPDATSTYAVQGSDYVVVDDFASGTN